ncbi:DUF1801 domain-containing protein [Shewanella eurypsychrophilus]|uniref:DUF1801 domain-containing protein n=1 Tax=Shewanella eurypsychrophilus TaxID=2593656 RepID=A0ABX6V5E9_9GAMM|nr:MULTISPECIES: DUF1801 domain-containing protein [Shewanella]QFU22328.1 DUF1801 domain-containing protein [Shewanella sp. YLB-09]QPG57614.1 DUF1801 domain-containing protein [Shewanella eurypsychrophilus]
MNKIIKQKFDAYPDNIAQILMGLRQTILDLAAELEDGEVEEALKWGEPSYIVKHGSTVRFDWKVATPSQYRIYFNCNTRLVETFKELYGNTFTYEGNRAMVFSTSDIIPLTELKHCLSLSLRYHSIKHLPLLGA